MRVGLNDLPFDIPNICIETNKARAQVRIGWLRSVCNIQHAFAIGSMADEVAVARNMDPVEDILDLLGSDRNIPVDKLVKEEYDNYGEPIEEYPWNTGRLKNVVEVVAEKSNWGKSLPAGRGQGITAHRSFLTYVACVVEVEVNNGQISIPEIHYAVDCGIVVNPDRVRSQFEGGAIFALSFALKSAITLKDGQVVQSNFDDYELARMMECPGETYVHLVESKEKPTGVGEPPVPPVAPALCNAIYKATGKRIRELPIQLS